MRRTLLTLSLGLVLMLAVVSCASGGGSGTGSPSGNTINAVMTEMKFDPASWTVKAGQQVTISAKNSGTVVHDWAVRGMEAQTFVEAEAGKTGTKSFTVAAAGSYDVYCSQPGHEAAGMIGKLTVQ